MDERSGLYLPPAVGESSLYFASSDLGSGAGGNKSHGAIDRCQDHHHSSLITETIVIANAMGPM